VHIFAWILAIALGIGCGVAYQFGHKAGPASPLAAQISANEAKLAETSKRQEGELERLRAKLADQRAQLTTMETRKADLLREQADLKSQIADFQTLLNNKRGSDNTATMAGGVQKATRTEADTSRLTDEIARLEKEVDAVKQGLAALGL
jgi:chromosome segregation ATPase